MGLAWDGKKNFIQNVSDSCWSGKSGGLSYAENAQTDRSEYVPSPEDLEAVAEENSAALLEDMAGENSEAVRAAEAESKTNTAESETGTEYVETLAGVPTGEIYSEKALMDPDFLLEHF